jgi:staphyloferrin B synthase
MRRRVTSPSALLNNSAYRLIPMAALGTALPNEEQHFFDRWLKGRRLSVTPDSVTYLFKELCESFFEINLRMFRIGLLAEVHGQNAVLVLRSDHTFGLLLRDHDSLRLYVPWLEKNGLADPEYCIKPGHANTLYHDTPEELLFYLQTLAIQVNLRAIIETLCQRYALVQETLWSTLQEVLERIIEQIEFSPEARALLREQLFTAQDWPLKLLVWPMIERGSGPGSMPFGKGRTQNPFRALAARHVKNENSKAQLSFVNRVPDEVS